VDLDDGVPVNMVHRVMGHELSSTTWIFTPGAPTITAASCARSMTRPTMTSADDRQWSLA
jgi:hypothetical protein